MYEANKQDTFVYVGALYANMSPWALIGGEYELSELLIDELKVHVIRYDSTFNFSDLSSDEPADTTAEPAHFYLNNFQLKNSSILYSDAVTQTAYPLHALNISVPYYAWNSKKTEASLNFLLGERGKVNISAAMNEQRQAYNVDLEMGDIDLAYGQSYLLELFNIQSTKGYLHTDLSIQGSLSNSLDISTKGTLGLTALNITDKQGNPFSSIDSVGVTIDSVNLADNYFYFSETTVRKPVAYASFSRESSNIDYVLQPVMTTSTHHDSVQVEESSVEESSPFYFGIGKAIIEQGTIDYTDRTMDRPFHYVLSNLNVSTTGISTDSGNLASTFSMITNGKGTISGNSSFSLVSPNNMQLNAKVRDMELLSLSPYSEYYVAAPIMQGVFNYDLSFTMTPEHLDNQNTFDIRELEFGKKIVSDSAYKVPVKLALVLMKDKNDNIQFEVPISGNPSDPDFKIWPIVGQTLKKFFIKAASKPLSMASSIVGKNPEDADKLVFAYSQNYLDEQQKKELDRIVEFHMKKPSLKFSFVQMTNPQEEKLAMAIINAKKQFNANDWQNVSNNDPSFTTFLNDRTGGGTFEQMCIKVIGEGPLEAKLLALLSERNNLVIDYLKNKQMPETAFEVRTVDLKNMGEEAKKPLFKIEVSVD